MAHHLLLRWSGLPETVERHKAIADRTGSVWWGKWARSPDGRDPISSETREELAQQVRAGTSTSVFLHNRDHEWRASLLDIRDRGFKPPAGSVPDYYPEGQAIDLWVQLGNFERVPLGWMEKNLTFARGAAAGSRVHFRGMNPVYLVDETGAPGDPTRVISSGVRPNRPPPPPALPAEDEIHDEFDLEWLESTTFWSRHELLEVIETLLHRRPQVALAGPPGTGKTWVAERLALHLTGGRSDAVHVVQFHPTFSYEDFVEGLRPVPGAGGIAFDVIPGPLVAAAEQAENADHPVVLVIDEMNRANLPSVFGELLYLLEYRDKPIDLLHRKEFSLPRNLYVIGTMNTADRSIRSMDTALRRRFDIFDCSARSDVLSAYYEHESKNSVAGLAIGLEKLNEQLTSELDRHHTIGHSFFMRPEFDSVELHRVWDRQVQPLIEEYFFDQPDLAESFTLQSFWPTATK